VGDFIGSWERKFYRSQVSEVECMFENLLIEDVLLRGFLSSRYGGVVKCISCLPPIRFVMVFWTFLQDVIC
jgi:hypothetical protein